MQDLEKVGLSRGEYVLLTMMLSREIMEYRGCPYTGVKEYVEECTKLRAKLKKAGERLEKKTHP